MKVKHYCDECGVELAEDADFCDDHPKADVLSIATPEDRTRESVITTSRPKEDKPRK